MDEPEISVVIPAHDAAGVIHGQLEALVRQVDPPRFEVVVADNRSTDATADAALTFADRLDLRVVPAHRRQGVNCARNAGIAAARAPVVVLLDADDVAGEHTLRAMLDEMEADPGVGIVAGVLSMHDPATFELERPQGHLPYAPGGFMALRREVFDAIGGFDEGFVGGHDEVDFCWRAQDAGHRIGLARRARLERMDRPTARGEFRKWRRYGLTYVQLYAKHRRRGIAGSSPRAEKPLVKRVLKQVPRLFAADQEARQDAAGFIGWHLGRWTGNVRYRTWGPK